VRRYLLEAGLYVRASRDRDARVALDAFLDGAFAQVDFATVVWLELQAGVTSGAEQDALDELVAPYLDLDRMLAPSLGAWREAGRILVELASAKAVDLQALPAWQLQDVLLAVLSREHGRILVTTNADGFGRIGRYLDGFQFVAPYPRLRLS
jgi:predicted nucleic acid-binding protein